MRRNPATWRSMADFDSKADENSTEADTRFPMSGSRGKRDVFAMA
jgi:hypothetical protein